MGEAEFMLQQIQEKINAGFRCIKLKIGSLDFEKELEILESIREKYDAGQITLRVDANGAFIRMKRWKNCTGWRHSNSIPLNNPLPPDSGMKWLRFVKNLPFR
jgi:L-alanine-DL-glutamate epimerase-like enolase superfamily enzyme